MKSLLRILGESIGCFQASNKSEQAPNGLSSKRLENKAFLKVGMDSTSTNPEFPDPKGSGDGRESSSSVIELLSSSDDEIHQHEPNNTRVFLDESSFEDNQHERNNTRALTSEMSVFEDESSSDPQGGKESSSKSELQSNPNPSGSSRLSKIFKRKYFEVHNASPASRTSSSQKSPSSMASAGGDIFSPRKRRRKRTKDIVISSPLASRSLENTFSGNDRNCSKGLGISLSRPSSSLPLHSLNAEDTIFSFLGDENRDKVIEKKHISCVKPLSNEKPLLCKPEGNLNAAKDPAPSSDAKSLGYGSNRSVSSGKESNEAAKWPEKAVPQFKLPRELIPHNKPGVCDYGVIRTSRLRNRKKKDAPDDVLYQNIQGQRRCRATRDGRVMDGAGNSNRCLNCAEGLFKYCHSHRALDMEQNMFWEKRMREKKLMKSASSIESSKPKPRPKAEMRSTEAVVKSKDKIRMLGSTCVIANDVNQCTFHIRKRGKRCQTSKTKGKICCNYHTKYEKMEKVGGMMNCIAMAATTGTRCKNKAWQNFVFCTFHQRHPPETVVPDLGEKKTKDSSTHLGSSESSKTSTAVYKKLSNQSRHGKNQVPKNIEFARSIDCSDSKLSFATNFHDMCFGIYRTQQCVYKCVEGDIFCPKCQLCNEQGKPFEHIGLDGAKHPDLDMLQLSQCLNVKGLQQCKKMASKSSSFCSDCCKLLFKWSEHDDDRSEETSSNSSSEDSDTIFSDTTTSEMSLESDNIDYDAYCSGYTHQEFLNMWKNFERKTEKIDDVEDSRLIKKANNSMDPTDTDGQMKAQYGRVLPHAMKRLMRILDLGKDDVFLDIGHGVGNTCLHASFCVGCDSRGIEVVADRHDIAQKICGAMYAEHDWRSPESRPEIGKVDLRLGRLEDPDQRAFLTKGVTRAYVNNFNGVFAERSSKNNDKWFLDDYISAIFASMAPGAIMVTFHPLNLALDRDSANELRNRHELEQSEYASYFNSEKILLGQARSSVKWNQRSGNTNEIYIYKYTRLDQPNHDEAVFLCSNPSCKIAIEMIPIPATRMNEDGRCVVNHCECKFSPKNLRKRNSK